MKVTFVLPGGSRLPAGGPRMVLRYANALAASGWTPMVLMPSDVGGASLWLRVLRNGRFLLSQSTHNYLPRTWMKLHPAVEVRWVRNLDAEAAPAAEAVVATAVQTAEAVVHWPSNAGRRFYFVQGYETWDFPASRVEASWKLPLKKIAVSRWLCELIAGATGERAEYLPNGLDHEAFGLDRPVGTRRDQIVLWPHHRIPQKGSADALAAIQNIQIQFPDLRPFAFGTGPAPKLRSSHINYLRNPPQPVLRSLYNEATVMIAPSHSEGWGLPACEALQCGCALAASDVGGHREFLRHEHNALLHAPGDVAALQNNVRRLLCDDPLRLRLAQQGLEDMTNLRFEPAVERLKLILTDTDHR